MNANVFVHNQMLVMFWITVLGVSHNMLLGGGLPSLSAFHSCSCLLLLLTKLLHLCDVMLSVLLAYSTMSYILSQLEIWSKICVFSCDANFKLYKRIGRTN